MIISCKSLSMYIYLYIYLYIHTPYIHMAIWTSIIQRGGLLVFFYIHEDDALLNCTMAVDFSWRTLRTNKYVETGCIEKHSQIPLEFIFGRAFRDSYEIPFFLPWTSNIDLPWTSRLVCSLPDWNIKQKRTKLHI